MISKLCDESAGEKVDVFSIQKKTNTYGIVITTTMNGRIPHSIARRLARPPPISPFATFSIAHHHPSFHPEFPRRHLSVNSFIPRIFSPSWWSQQLPKGLFKAKPSTTTTARRKWNPAWGYVLLALFVGSQSLNIIALRQEGVVFLRRADARIRTLREIIEKIQEGEWEPDGPEVRKALRLGNQQDDRLWEEILQEVEEEDAKWQAEAQRMRERVEAEEQAKAKFASLSSPTAYAEEKGSQSDQQGPPKKKLSADDYFM
ncbi:hypothetical protein TWF694_010741 [Orbilia ellipsospora]|uniref:Uncharacterized protein n=1 Tax=Orbilia ellipsospora TaxID=2528407 RepID=A0AAV9X9I5_9PEZI